jgi:hypothetical protein
LNRLKSNTVVSDLELQGVVSHDECDENTRVFAVAVLEGVDARFNDGELDFVNLVFLEVHHPGKTRGGLHGGELHVGEYRENHIHLGLGVFRHCHNLPPASRFYSPSRLTQLQIADYGLQIEETPGTTETRRKTLQKQRRIVNSQLQIGFFILHSALPFL